MLSLSVKLLGEVLSGGREATTTSRLQHLGNAGHTSSHGFVSQMNFRVSVISFYKITVNL
jgi:hypothetical protein